MRKLKQHNSWNIFSEQQDQLRYLNYLPLLWYLHTHFQTGLSTAIAKQSTVEVPLKANLNINSRENDTCLSIQMVENIHDALSGEICLLYFYRCFIMFWKWPWMDILYLYSSSAFVDYNKYILPQTSYINFFLLSASYNWLFDWKF